MALTAEQVKYILDTHPGVKADVAKYDESASEQTARVNRWYTKYGAKQYPNLFANMPKSKTAVATPVDYITSAATKIKSLDELLGITGIQSEISGYDKTIAEKKAKLNEALGVVNENPWLAEASRLGRGKRLQEMANLDIANIVEQRGQATEKLGYFTTRLGDILDLGTQKEQTDLQKLQIAQSKEQFEKNLAFDTLKFQKELKLKKSDAKRLAEEFNRQQSLNEDEFDWKKVYDQLYLSSLNSNPFG